MAKRSTLSNTALLFASQILPLIFGLIAIPILTTKLGLDRYGILTLLWAVVGYFALFDVGIGRALIKYLAALSAEGDPEREAKVFWPSFLSVAAVSLIGAVALFLLSGWLARSVLQVSPEFETEAWQTIQILALAVPFVTVSGVLRGALESKRAFLSVSIIQTLNGSLLFVVPVLVAIYSTNLAHLSMGIGISRVGVFFLYAISVLKLNPHFLIYRSVSFQFLRPVLRLGGWMTVSNIIGPLLVYMDRFFIGSLVLASSIAFYTTPFEILSRTLVLPSALFRVLFPSLSSLDSSSTERAIQILRRAMVFLMFILSLMLLPLSLFAKEGLYLWLGISFAENSEIITQLLILGVFVNSIGGLLLTYAHSIGRPDITAKLHLAEFVPYIFILWLLVGEFGLKGAALAWTIRVAADTSLLLVFLAKRNEVVRALVKPLIHNSIIFLVLLLPVFFISSDLGDLTKWVIIKFAYLAVSLFLFGSYLMLVCCGNEDREYLKSLILGRSRTNGR